MCPRGGIWLGGLRPADPALRGGRGPRLGGHRDAQGQDHDAECFNTHRRRLYGQSPSDIPIARAVRTTSKSGGTVLIRPTTFSSGTATLSGGSKATTCSNVPPLSASTARARNRV